MEKLFNHILKHGLTPNGLYLLYNMREKVSTILINHTVELAKLLAGGWITQNKELTSKATDLLVEVEAYFKKTRAKVQKAVLGADCRPYVEQYRSLWPAGLLPSGSPGRQSVPKLTDAFEWFFQNYPEYADWNLILTVAEKYVSLFADQEYRGLRTSKYFIQKQDPLTKKFSSDLADYCGLYLDNEEENENIPLPQIGVTIV